MSQQDHNDFMSNVAFDITDYVNHQTHQELDFTSNPVGDTASSQAPDDSAMSQPQSQLDMESIQSLLGMMNDPSLQNSQNQSLNASNSMQRTPPNLTADLLNHLKLQQFQQLQQMQNQLFQQQMELIRASRAIPSLDSANMQSSLPFHGLPTPLGSSELRPQINTDLPLSELVSPMLPPMQDMYNYAPPQGPPSSVGMSPLVSPGSSNPINPTMSAPARLAFQPPLHMASPGGMDFDLSPISSPWLGPIGSSNTSSNVQLSQNPNASGQTPIQRPVKKRSNPSSDGQGTSKKRQSGLSQQSTSRSAGANVRLSGSSSNSATSTPTSRAMTRRRSSTVGVASTIPGSGGGEVALNGGDQQMDDSPSPVDLSMPPPAAPASYNMQQPNGSNGNIGQGNDAGKTHSRSGSHLAGGGTSIEPVTPATIMNLGRFTLPTGLMAHPPHQNTSVEKGKEKASNNMSNGASSSNINSSSQETHHSTHQAPRQTKKAPASRSLVSPALKPLLPEGIPASSASTLAAQPNYAHHMSGSSSTLNITPSTPLPLPQMQGRKSSHKAAEQKRRDSLKSSFNELRLLLPPIPLPTEDGFLGGDDPPLPGAMPPRGPPRGEGDGPNRGVSKLQLLRCGNHFIRELKGRVSRRDDEIEKLRREVRKLRGLRNMKENEGGEAGLAGVEEDEEELDLDKDLDAIEKEGEGRRAGMMASMNAGNPGGGGGGYEGEDYDDGDD
ncbi:hypothetical protein SISSUDRAFT_1065042 [Sistotremastrum suecicum HHB10207 ss-3]|uniref:BHLH domain-containing protein n=1 Tax=Sistotremastrum suecicum HHB10207 ss-3 TaxID=1314776 RepID=A0A165ZYU8_9AGAM|nr:hypothetical protein SISSUDRAFT_1065042 [Sistotremastrum suecicum HHB10207 ss-3]